MRNYAKTLHKIFKETYGHHAPILQTYMRGCTCYSESVPVTPSFNDIYTNYMVVYEET